jgi:hypothetical protein
MTLHHRTSNLSLSQEYYFVADVSGGNREVRSSIAHALGTRAEAHYATSTLKGWQNGVWSKELLCRWLCIQSALVYLAGVGKAISKKVCLIAVDQHGYF